MEKEPQPESMATVTIKPDYPPSEYSSEPPPAYHRSQSSAVQVAKIVAVTVVLVSFVLGSFILASAYITANASCRQLEQELELLSEAADRFQQPPLQPEALVQEEPIHKKVHADTLQTEETKTSNDIDSNGINDNESSSSESNSDSDSSSESEEESEEKTRHPIHFKLPLQLDFDDLAGALIDKNQKSRMNCVVEKKRAVEIVDHQPKTLRLPFGLNLTTDPRYERISGERMAIFCESGNVQRQNPQENDDDEDSDEDTVMIQPVMIPIAQTHYQTHMPQQMRPIQPTPQQIEVMRQQQAAQQSQQVPNAFPPTAILHQIAQQIITQKIMEAQRARTEHQQIQENTVVQNEQQPEQQRFSEEMVEQQRLPIPEEVLTQLNRLPNRDMIVAVSEQEPQEVSQDQENNSSGQEMNTNEVRIPQAIRMIPQTMVQAQMQVVQQPRTNPNEMNGRQTYARAMPVHIPVHMIQQQQEQQEPQAAAAENLRPHFVQPRSVRSVDALLSKNQKRVKRCSCDCAC